MTMTRLLKRYTTSSMKRPMSNAVYWCTQSADNPALAASLPSTWWWSLDGPLWRPLSISTLAGPTLSCVEVSYSSCLSGRDALGRYIPKGLTAGKSCFLQMERKAYRVPLLITLGTHTLMNFCWEIHLWMRRCRLLILLLTGKKEIYRMPMIPSFLRYSGQRTSINLKGSIWKQHQIKCKAPPLIKRINRKPQMRRKRSNRCQKLKHIVTASPLSRS